MGYVLRALLFAADSLESNRSGNGLGFLSCLQVPESLAVGEDLNLLTGIVCRSGQEPIEMLVRLLTVNRQQTLRRNLAMLFDRGMEVILQTIRVATR